MSERRIPIAGMTCASCEDTVSRALSSLPGVESASVSARAGAVHLTGKDLPTDGAIAGALVDTPYRLGTRPWVARERAVWSDLFFGGAVVAALFLVISAWNPGARLDGATTGLTWGTALVVLGLGVAASLSTCMALVGGLVMSLSASVGASSSQRATVASRQAAFNVGRVVGFGALGAIAGAIGQAFALQGVALAVAMIVVAVATGILGIRLTEVSPRIGAWQFTLPTAWAAWAKRSPATKGTHQRLSRGAHAPNLRAAGLGAATFFLPCGFTQVAQLLALASGSPLVGGVTMALFALGTAPGLFAVGMAAASARAAKARRPMRMIGVVVIAFAFVTGLGGVTGTGLLSPYAAVAATERTDNVVDIDGRQVVTTEIGLQGYFPADAVVYVNEPVTWVLDPVGVGCASLVDAASLGLGRLNAISEKVLSDFTPTKTGTYQYHCAMGMFTGSFTVIERPEPASASGS